MCCRRLDAEVLAERKQRISGGPDVLRIERQRTITVYDSVELPPHGAQPSGQFARQMIVSLDGSEPQMEAV